jgi:hypothetical protein
MVYYPWLSEHALKFIERLARSDSPPLIRTYSDESTEEGLAWSRPPHPPPRMTGAIPAGRMGQRRGSDHKLRDEHHSSSNDNESDDDNNDRTIELPRNRARGRDVYPTHGRGGRVLRQNITYYTDVIERETVRRENENPWGGAWHDLWKSKQMIPVTGTKVINTQPKRLTNDTQIPCTEKRLLRLIRYQMRTDMHESLAENRPPSTRLMTTLPSFQYPDLHQMGIDTLSTPLAPGCILGSCGLLTCIARSHLRPRFRVSC